MCSSDLSPSHSNHGGHGQDAAGDDHDGQQVEDQPGAEHAGDGHHPGAVDDGVGRGGDRQHGPGVAAEDRGHGRDERVDADGDGKAQVTSRLTGEITSLVADAHDAGLKVTPYTLRAEEPFLALEDDGTAQTLPEQVELLTKLGVDGLFTDQPGVADRKSVV